MLGHVEDKDAIFTLVASILFIEHYKKLIKISLKSYRPNIRTNSSSRNLRIY